MFVRNAWYVAAASTEVTSRPLARTLLGEPVVLVRELAGGPIALEDRCCHRAAPLSLGWMSDEGLVCGYHGFTFDGTGACVAIPGHRGKVPARACVKSYPIVEKADYLWIWMGDPQKADLAKIVDYPPDDPVNFPRQSDMLHVKASYELVLENLMDLSHLSYVHRNSIGSSQEDSANASMEVKRTSGGIRFLRLMLNAKTPELFRKIYGLTERCDRWADFEYIAPSCVRQYSGAVDAGRYERGALEGQLDARILHAVTPETEASCFYYFNRADAYEKNAPPDYKRTPTTEVFKEDAVVLEQQQLRLTGYDSRRLIDAPSDVVRAPMSRILHELLRSEAIESQPSIGNQP